MCHVFSDHLLDLLDLMFVNQLFFSYLLEGELLLASGRFVRIVLAKWITYCLRIIEIVLIYSYFTVSFDLQWPG